MPRTPTYRKHTTSDRAFVQHQGKRHYLPGRYNSPESRAAFKAFLARIKAEATKPVVIQASDKHLVTIGKLAAAYLEHASTYYGDDPRGTYREIRRIIQAVLKDCGHRNTVAVNFGPMALKEIRQHWIDQGLARETINGRVSKIKTWFKSCASEELVAAEIWHALQSVEGLKKNRSAAREPAPRKPVAWLDVEPAFAHLQPVTAAMLWLQWYSGARSESVCLAKPEQFTPDGDLLLWRPRHKTEYLDKSVVLPIGPKCRAKIAAYLNGRPADRFMFNPREGRNGVNCRYNDHYVPYTYRQAIVRAQRIARARAEEAGERPPQLWTPHQLRHTRGSEVRQKYGIEAAQAILGHESLVATQIYSERRLDLAKQIAEKDG